ncbi:MAG: Hemolysin-type calcium-binding region [Caulobacter sp.]|nr:Hemolysin-type calcium-binding region [Caulobacter sp.]
MSSTTLAFQGVEGYGAATVGGRGGQVLTVTNLNDSGAGSLRWALEDVSGPRTVVFAVNGVIHLDTQILIQNDYVTIAGQTAPGDGITLEGSRIRVKADEVIIRGMHFRPGDGETGQDPADRDGLMIGTTDFTIRNVVVDHNSFEWATDENLSLNGSMDGVTISNNIIAEGLSNSLNPKGEHSKGLLLSNWDQLDGAADINISILRNLFAGNEQRNPEVRAGQNVEILNNYIYDAGLSGRIIAIGGGSEGVLATTVKIVGNVMASGLDSRPDDRAPISVSDMGAGSSIYLADNLWSDLSVDAAGNQDQTLLAWDDGGLKYVVAAASFGSGATILDSQDVAGYVLAHAGANPGARDTVDAYVVAAALQGAPLIVDTVDQAGGYPSVEAVRAAVDTDLDGMPNWFEDLYGFNSKVADNNGDSDHDGYTNIEEYINGLIDGVALIPARPLLTVLPLDGHNDTLVFGADALILGRVVVGFDPNEGDRIDLTALLGDYDPAADNLSDYLQITQFGGAQIIAVDRDGVGGQYVMTFVAELVDTPDFFTQTTIIASTANAFKDVVGDIAGNTLKGATTADRLLGLAGADTLMGMAGADWLEGGAGADKLDGGAGDDVMIGGADNDTYTVDSTGDVVVELAGGGDIDLVNAGVDYVLGAEIENLNLTGTAAIDGTGNTLANKIIGNAASNTIDGGLGDDLLSGGAGDDRLYGGAGVDKLDGGLGADLMIGGQGGDAYVVDNVGDVISELADGGVDTVNASVSYTLTAELETLILSGTAAINGTGNGLDNKIAGNAAANVIDGGAGDDQLTGGDGADRLIGGLGNDKIDGGLGADAMIGGAGNDSYVVDNAADTITELANGGSDTVSATASWVMSLEIETLTLGGTGAINGTGSAQANKITGNGAANLLDGKAGDDALSGGAGADKLTGGAGFDALTGGADADTFIFANGDAALTTGTSDTITDFLVGTDHIDLAGVSGKLAASAFSSVWLSGATYASALAKAQAIMTAGHQTAVFIAGAKDGWLFWNTDSNPLPDQVVLLKGLGFASQAGFDSGHHFTIDGII